ncbi:MAG: M48 family metalloprotease [Fimbriimonadales bacterium]|nr:M48 family metalloprotease [Fimbriimonadales bacterium]
MFWFTLLLTSLGILVLGRWFVRPGASFGRTMRLLKHLLWLSILVKASHGTLAYLREPSLAPPLWALTLIMGGAQVIGEFALLFRWLYPVERAQRGLQASLVEYVLARLRLVWDALAPILIAGLGTLTLSYIATGQYRTWGVWGVLTAGTMGLTVLLIGIGLMRRPTPLPIRSVPVETHLLEEAQRLGRELGVQVREVLVLDGMRLRRANAFALSGGRIAITDYLLASLTEREALSVIAHEVAHLAQRRRLVRLWIVQLSAGGGVALMLAPLWERLPAWGLLVWLVLLAAGMALPLLHLRQRHEREADAFAVSQYGVEPLASALRKVATLHLREADRRGDAVHPALNARLEYLGRHFKYPKATDGF